MNEQIKQIAIEAKVEHCVSHVRLQEFARLLVKDIAEEIACNGHVSGFELADKIIARYES